MQSTARINTVALLTGTLDRSILKVFLRLSSTLVTKFGIRISPVDKLITFSSFLNLDGNRSPDACILRSWDSLRPDDDDAFGCSPF